MWFYSFSVGSGEDGTCCVATVVVFDGQDLCYRELYAVAPASCRFKLSLVITQVIANWRFTHH